MAPSQYLPDERSKGGRLPKRTKYDTELVHKILNGVPILHVAFNAPPKEGPQFPTILPMLGAVATYKSASSSSSGDNDHDDEDEEEEEDPSLYLHGSSVARLFRLTQGSEIALCVCGTLMDGYVLALAPFHNSCNYRSAVAYGYGSIVEDPQEVQFALRLITNNSIPERWENSRTPTTKAELQSTAVLKMRIETASAKVRAGGPNDDKADLEDAEVVQRTWVGVVPTYLTLGEPIAGELNRVKQLPEYLDDWVQDVNSMNEQRAIDAVDESAK